MKTSRKDFAKPWARLCAAHPRFEASEATIAVYYERLCRFPVANIERGVTAVIDRNEFFPSVAELIGAIRSLPPARHKLLDEPKPSPEKVAKDREELRKLIEKSQPAPKQKQDEQERRQFLRDQAARLNAAEK